MGLVTAIPASYLYSQANQNNSYTKSENQYDDTSTTLPSENDFISPRITANRALHANLRNNSGTEVGTSSNPLGVNGTLTVINSNQNYLTSGYLFSAATSYTCPTSGAHNPVIYFRNPTGSGKNIFIVSILANVNVTNVLVEYRLYSSPTVSANGSTLDAYQRNIGDSTTASALVTTVPTVTSNGNLLIDTNSGQNNPPMEMLHDYTVGVKPNNSILFTCEPGSNNRMITVTFVWAEVPQ